VGYTPTNQYTMAQRMGRRHIRQGMTAPRSTILSHAYKHDSFHKQRPWNANHNTCTRTRLPNTTVTGLGHHVSKP
jgi:hypothetical protein